MIATLIPFFLAANVTTNETYWIYGPEVIYNARIDVTSRPLDPSENTVMINMMMKLKCRPKSDMDLSCRFDNPRLVLTLLKPLGESTIKDMEELGEHGLGDDLFELKFDPDGLEEMVVSSAINTSKLDMIRTLVGHLNFGTDLTAHSINFLRGKTESTADECKTSYLMWLNAVDKGNFEKNEIDSYELLVLPNSRSTSGEKRRMQKTRHINDCSYPANYFFGSWTTRRASPTIQMKLKSSTSHMNVTGSSFVSFTEIELLLSNRRNSTIATLTERLSVGLDKIVPASRPLPVIRDPLVVGVIPKRWLHSDSAEEM